MSELQAIATHPLVRLCFNWTHERWLFAEYYQHVQSRSEELLSLRDVIERWRCTPYPVLFQEMRNA